MPRIPLTEGTYQARSVIAEAQRCVNLYAERNPKDALVPFTFYGAPGLSALGSAPSLPARGLYWANNDQLYYVAGSNVYAVSAGWNLTKLGTIGTSSGIVSMADNGTTLGLVDGSGNGYQINLTTNAFSQISAANNSPPSPQVYAFYGANRVDMLDGYMLFNQPGTRNFYSTYNNEIVFDSLYFAAKNGYSDDLVSLAVTLREIWLIGQRTTEIWFDSGGSAFPFQIMPGPFVQHGCIATYSVATVDGAVFWLSQDQAGTNIIVRGRGYEAQRISTHAMEVAMSTYSTTTDAIGFCFQLQGHIFYQLNFPTANKTWRWDDITGLWHEAVYVDSNGNENMHPVTCVANAYGVVVGADYQTGQLYQISMANYTDNGQPMYFRRGFPHIMNDGKRVIYPAFVLDCQAGTSPDTVDQPGPFPLLANTGTILASNLGIGLLGGPAPIDTAPQVLLRWSDDRGTTWSQPIAQSLGATGQYIVQPKWWRLGMARDRVFEAYGVIPAAGFAINGAFLDPAPMALAS